MLEGKIKLEIIDVTTEGQGVGKIDSLAVFVPGTIPGDKVTIEIQKQKKSFAIGKLVSIDEPSPNRREGFCQYERECGGCGLALMNYESQLKQKEKWVMDKITRIGGFENPKINPIIGGEQIEHYRNKGTLQISPKGQVGFYKKKTNYVVDCLECKIQELSVICVADGVREYLKEAKIKKQVIKQVVVKTSKATKEVMVNFILENEKEKRPEAIKDLQLLVDILFDVLEESGYTLASIFINGITLVAGKNTIVEKINGMDFEISPRAFYQVNTEMAEKLFNNVKEKADLKGDENILDLYCGVGTIGLNLSGKAKNVLGIEVIKDSILNANRNAVINGVINTIFLQGKAEEELPKLLEDDGKELEEGSIRLKMIEIAKECNLVVLDPPRAGCDAKLLEAVETVAPEKILYVSCDPATLARDIKMLCEKSYRFVEATPIDMFPQTCNVETVVLLEKN